MRSDIAKLTLRLAGGILMIPHGYSKLQKLIAEGAEAGFADPLGFGELPSLILTIFAELVCAILVLIGFKTRLVSIPLIITMLVAALVVHINDPFNKMELPLLYAAVYSALALFGAGKFSVDGR